MKLKKLVSASSFFYQYHNPHKIAHTCPLYRFWKFRGLRHTAYQSTNNYCLTAFIGLQNLCRKWRPRVTMIKNFFLKLGCLLRLTYIGIFQRWAHGIFLLYKIDIMTVFTYHFLLFLLFHISVGTVYFSDYQTWLKNFQCQVTYVLSAQNYLSKWSNIKTAIQRGIDMH